MVVTGPRFVLTTVLVFACSVTKGSAVTNTTASNVVPGGPVQLLASQFLLNNPNIMKLFSGGLLQSLAQNFYSGLLAGAAEDQQECLNDTEKIIEDLMTGTPYTLQYIDAAAKIPSGIMELKWLWVGAYQECISVPETFNPGTGHNFGGKHFLVLIHINGESIFSSIPFPLAIGVCLPDSCDAGTVGTVFSAVLSGVKEISVVGAVTPEKQVYSTGAIVALTVCAVLASLVIIGTLLSLFEDRREKERKQAELSVTENGSTFNKDTTESTQHLASVEFQISQGHRSRATQVFVDFLKCFSFVDNTKRLASTATAVGPLSCLNGMRVISMWWVIQGHTYEFSRMFIDNLAQALKIGERFEFQPIINGTFSVDTFFFLSGLLVAYLALREMNAKGRMNWVYFIVHRYWRLTALYAIILMIITTLMLHMIYGPFQILATTPLSFIAQATQDCNKYWWTNLLYINNFYPHHGSTGSTCMPWAWYLANDMQFYVFISPIIIMLLHKKRAVGITVTLSLIVVGVAIRAGLCGYYGLTGLDNVLHKHTDDEYAKQGVLYQRPYARYSVYLVGMLTGYILCATNVKLRMNKGLATIGWSVAIATGIAVIYGQFYYNSHQDSHMTDVVAGFYVSLCRTAWSISLAWVVLACASGYGGPVHTILSLKLWAPLGRLTYAAYLVHPIMIVLYYTNLEVKIHFTDWVMVYVFLGNLVVSYGVAYVLSMAVEAPMIQVEKLLLKQFRKEKASQGK